MHASPSPSRVLQASFPPEPARSKWDRFNLPPSPFVSVPIQFIEILMYSHTQTTHKAAVQQIGRSWQSQRT